MGGEGASSGARRKCEGTISKKSYTVYHMSTLGYAMVTTV